MTDYSDYFKILMEDISEAREDLAILEKTKGIDRVRLGRVERTMEKVQEYLE